MKINSRKGNGVTGVDLSDLLYWEIERQHCASKFAPILFSVGMGGPTACSW
jgi:hypothetical protein